MQVKTIHLSVGLAFLTDEIIKVPSQLTPIAEPGRL
jgi:hypothetical protein